MKYHVTLLPLLSLGSVAAVSAATEVSSAMKKRSNLFCMVGLTIGLKIVLRQK